MTTCSRSRRGGLREGEKIGTGGADDFDDGVEDFQNWKSVTSPSTVHELACDTSWPLKLRLRDSDWPSHDPLSMRADPYFETVSHYATRRFGNSNEGEPLEVRAPIPSKAFVLVYFLLRKGFEIGAASVLQLAGDTLDPGLRKINGLELSQQ